MEGLPFWQTAHITHVAIAKMAHEINRAYCLAIGDTSQTTWEDAPDWQKDSAVKGVIFHLENPNATPENSHESWLKEKEADGWKYGPVKNPETKEHPCFVPYAELPVEQKAKDYLFRQAVHSAAGVVITSLKHNGDQFLANQELRELTYGEKAVRITFNPGRNEKVERLKRAAADFIDTINQCATEEKEIPSDPEIGERLALLKLAQRDAQSAQMWAVKAVTWQR